MLFALFKKWWGWDIFHPTRTYSSLKFNLKCDFRVLSSFIYYHHHLWYIVVICRTKNLTFLWASFRKWLHLLAANDLKEQRNWICQKFLMDFPQPELYLPPLIFTNLSFFWDTLYMCGVQGTNSSSVGADSTSDDTQGVLDGGWWE